MTLDRTLKLSELIAETNRAAIDEPNPRIMRLIACRDSLLRSHCFVPGQLVTWKSGMKNRRTPNEGEPVVVVAVLDAPIRDSEADPGSAYFHEPLDIIVGKFVDDQFHLFHMDMRRLMPFDATPD